MSNDTSTFKKFTDREYKYGFETLIEMDAAPKRDGVQVINHTVGAGSAPNDMGWFSALLSRPCARRYPPSRCAARARG